jgi:hypothetical protein
MTLTEIEKKILVLAMDSAAENGEAGAAAMKLMELFRKRYSDGYALIKDLEQIRVETRVQYRYESRPDPYANFIMPFGKHRGRKLKDIPVDYLEWVLQNFDGLRDATRTVIESYLANDTY